MLNVKKCLCWYSSIIKLKNARWNIEIINSVFGPYVLECFKHLVSFGFFLKCFEDIHVEACDADGIYVVLLVWFWPDSLAVGQGLINHEVSRSHTKTHHSRHDSSGRVISSLQRTLPDNTQHSQETNAHAPGGIRTDNISRRATADLRLRPRGNWDRLSFSVPS